MAGNRVRLEDMTWQEVDSHLSSDEAMAIVPIAATEQHGPHLPLSTDSLIGDELAYRCARRFENALVAPTIRIGTSPFHREFAGSLSISPEGLMSLVRDIAHSLESHGVEHIVLLPSHGGNFPSINALAPELAAELQTATLHTLADLERLSELMNDGLHEAGIDDDEPVVHAGATETAIMLTIAPSLVREDEIEPGYEGSLSMGGLLNNGFSQYTTTGVLGDPTNATAMAGEAILQAIVDAYVGQLGSEITELGRE